MASEPSQPDSLDQDAPATGSPATDAGLNAAASKAQNPANGQKSNAWQKIKAIWASCHHTVHAWLTNPVGELSRHGRFIRYMVELSLVVARQLKQVRAPQMAAALSFRTLFSLMPLLVMVFLVFKAVGKFDQALPAMRQSLATYLDLPELTKHEPTATEQSVTGLGIGAIEILAPAEANEHPLVERTEQLIQGLQDALDRIDFSAIGWVGLILFVWSALRLIVAAEQTFNQVVQSPVQRAWINRIVVYGWAVVFGPILLGYSLSAATLVAKRFESLPLLGYYIVEWGNAILAFFAAWLMFFLMYRLLPKRKLDYRPLMIGAFVTALGWEIWKHAFRIFIRFSFGGDSPTANTALYGSLALLPTFFFWVQITWMLVLFGLNLAYSLHVMPKQAHRQAQGTQVQQQGVVDARWAMPLLACIAKGFENGEVTPAERLAARTALPQNAVDTMLQAMIEHGLVREVMENDQPPMPGGFTLAKPADKLPAQSVYALISDLADNQQADPTLPGLATLRQWLNPIATVDHALGSNAPVPGQMVAAASAASADPASSGFAPPSNPANQTLSDLLVLEEGPR